MKANVKENGPMIVCLAIKINIDNNSNIWRRDREGMGGGVMVMPRKELLVTQVGREGQE